MSHLTYLDTSFLIHVNPNTLLSPPRPLSAINLHEFPHPTQSTLRTILPHRVRQSETTIISPPLRYGVGWLWIECLLDKRLEDE